MLIVFGAGWILRQAAFVAVSWPAIFSAVLVVLGIGMVATARSGARSRGLIVVGIVLSLLVSSTSSLDARFDLRAGDIVHRPASVAEVDPRYRIGLGELTIDLRQIEDTTEGAALPIAARVAFGELRVLVPDDVAVRIEGKVGGGDLTRDGRSLGEGIGVRRVYQSPGYDDAGARRVDLELSVLFGSIEVRGGR